MAKKFVEDPSAEAKLARAKVAVMAHRKSDRQKLTLVRKHLGIPDEDPPALGSTSQELSMLGAFDDMGTRDSQPEEGEEEHEEEDSEESLPRRRRRQEQ